MTWPIGKIDLINQALALTANNLVAVADDGSDEWNVASAAYEVAIEYMFDSHDWKEITNVVTLQPTGIAPADSQFDTAFAKPPDCVHVIWIKINDNKPTSSNTAQLALWKIAGTNNGPVIVINAQGGPPPPNPPVTPAQVTMYYITNSALMATSNTATPTLIVALISFVMAGIYRGLHEDIAEADKIWMAAERFLQQARTRYDQQKPKRQFFNSRIGAVRRIRRPWPQTGINNWGSGSGSGGTPG